MAELEAGRVGDLCVLRKHFCVEKAQMEEIAKGLLDCGRPFLWVIREKVEKKGDDNEAKKEEEMLSCREELEELGRIVPWCSQVAVLSSPSLVAL